eukprot:958162-Pyramimonas_sp.AAC.1
MQCNGDAMQWQCNAMAMPCHAMQGHSMQCHAMRLKPYIITISVHQLCLLGDSSVRSGGRGILEGHPDPL